MSREGEILADSPPASTTVGGRPCFIIQIWLATFNAAYASGQVPSAHREIAGETEIAIGIVKEHRGRLMEKMEAYKSAVPPKAEFLY
jgi:hypothetical protein